MLLSGTLTNSEQRLIHVETREGESFDQLVRRLNTSIDKSGILHKYKRKRYFKSGGEVQRDKATATTRRRPRRSRPRTDRPLRRPA